MIKKITLLIFLVCAFTFSSLYAQITVTCGTPTNTTNCYTNSTTQTWVFESSDGTSPLKAIFNAGETENNWDELIVYDSDGVTELYNGYGASGDLTGLEFTSSGTSITVQVTPDGSGDCPGNGYTPWDWDVVCLACNAPSSSGQTVVDDCPNSQFTVDVVIDGLGDGTSFVTDGTSMWAATALGTVTAGPFANGTPVTLTLAHGTDNTCDVALGTFSESGLCPTIVTCGTATNTTNCYTSSVIQTWVFESSDGTSPLKVIFNAGETENNWDELIVYDSDGVTELYNGYGASGDLTGLEFTSSGTSITVQVTPDGGVDCVSNGYTPWDWDVVCLACNAPSSSGQTVVDDCPNSQFTVDVVIDGLGDGTSFVTDGTSMWAATALGTVTAGPFANGTPVTLTLAHGTDNTCDVTLGTFSESGLCPTIVTCGTPVNTTNCYTNSTTQTWVFESSDGTSPLQVTFNAGETENNWDELIVYDSDGVTELYNGYGASGDLTGLTFISSGTSITVEVTPDGSGDCPGNGYIPWDWDVDCFACGTSAIGLPPMGTLASLTATISCDDSNWTYYENPSVAGEYLFAIEWDPGLAGDNTAAKAAASVTIDILAAMIEPAGNNATEASYGMARYWNVDLGGATLDSPVNVKFYYDPAEALATTTASAAHASGQDNGFSWFKTNGTTFTPADITATPFQSSVLILTPAGAGTDNGITYVQFDGITSFSGGTGAAGAGAGFLPIELASFSGQAMDNYNMLEWVTASEENTRMHVIERSLNGVADFREIGSVAAAGNSQTDIRYSLNDENPGALGYYRLKTIDLDGSVQYSDVISIQRKGDIFELVNTYPVPTTKDLTIEFVITEDEEVTYTLTDITGKVVMYNTIEATKGLNKQVIDIATISNGVYFLTLQNSTSRIIKNIVKN